MGNLTTATEPGSERLELNRIRDLRETRVRRSELNDVLTLPGATKVTSQRHCVSADRKVKTY